MKQAKSILYGAVALLLTAGNATAQSAQDIPTNASTIYAVDEDRDGRTDRELILEQSDSLA